MTVVLGVAETKRRFAELLDRVVRGERVVVTRRGRPVAALVPAAPEATDERPAPLGLAAFAGALEDDWPELEEFVKEIYADRLRSTGRPAPTFE